jgi:hypothetical protein
MGVMGKLALAMLAAIATVHAGQIHCEVRSNGIEKLVCTFETARKNVDRNVTFLWHSESHPQDDRERTINFPAHHGSVYDYRYLRGRAQGVWTVTVTLEGPEGETEETEHHFLLENDQLINEAL